MRKSQYFGNDTSDHQNNKTIKDGGIYKTLPEAQRTQGIAPKLELSLQLMVAPLALVPNLATRWRHLHELKNWPQDGATCISYMN